MNNENDTYRICVAAQLHAPQLEPGPLQVELSGFDERQVYTERPVRCRTVQTDEDAVGYARPARVFRSTIEAGLPFRDGRTENKR